MKLQTEFVLVGLVLNKKANQKDNIALLEY